MNLYALKFKHYSQKDSKHYSQKDSKEGIVTYLIAESSEAIYEWFKSEPTVNGNQIYNSYKDNEKDSTTFKIYDKDYNIIATETFKKRMIRLNGKMFDKNAESRDLFYGVIQYGWELIKEDVYYCDVIATQNLLGINIVDIT